MHEGRAENRAELAPGVPRQPRKVRRHHPHVPLDRKDPACLVVHGRCNDRFDKGRHDRLRRRLVYRAVQPDNAAERRDRVRFTRAHVGVCGAASGGRTARIRVLDDRGRRLAELEHNARGGVEIKQVRVRELLALEHLRIAQTRCRLLRVPRRLLMRVLAVPEIAKLAEAKCQSSRGNVLCRV